MRRIDGRELIARLSTFISDSGLRASSFRGGAILGVSGGFESAARLARNVIFARLLAPQLFGLMAVVLSFSGLLESLTEAGVRYAIIQNPRGNERAYLNIAWWFSSVRGLLLYSVAFAAAPLVARFYDNYELTWLIRVSCSAILFNGCLSVALFADMKGMEFKSWALACNGGSIISLAATVLFAFYYPTVWALVFGLVSDAAIRCIMSYVVRPFMPRWKFAKDDLAALLKYSRGFVGLPILYAVSRTADVFTLAKVASPGLVGIYSLASSLVRAPQDLVNRVVAQVALPALSAVQDDKPKLRKAVLQGVSLLASLAFPAIAFAWLYGGFLLRIVYGPRYAAAGIPFAILFTAAAIEITTVPIATLYFATGKPGLHRLFSLVRAAVLIISIAPACYLFGWNGAAFSVLLATAGGYAVQALRIRSIINIRTSEIVKSLGKPLIRTVAAFPVWLAGDGLFPGTNLKMRVTVAGLGLLIAYGLTAWPYLGRKGSYNSGDTPVMERGRKASGE
ncbi:MAG: oligosaccharide flippase family protein [Syntrophorhabdales bacterium]